MFKLKVESSSAQYLATAPAKNSAIPNYRLQLFSSAFGYVEAVLYICLHVL